MIRLSGELTVTFDGKELNEIAKVRDVERSLFGEIDVSTITMPGRIGAYAFESRKDVQIYVVRLLVSGKDQEDAVNKLNDIRRIVNSKREKDMVVSDEPYKTVQALLIDDTDYDTEVNTKALDLTFLIPKGYGKGSLMTHVLPVGTSNFYYDGTHETFPYITFEFSGASDGISLRMVNEEEDKSFNINGNFISGDVLELDFHRRKIKLNGDVRMNLRDVISSRWFHIMQGENELTLSGNINGTVKMDYNENWY